ncbi:MAG: hypothetical protein ACE5FH_05285 [Candidatus Zixiibacteriota bacterium]
MPEYAALRTDLIFSSTEIDGETIYNIKDPITGSYFRLRKPETWLVRQLDGQTSYDVIVQRFNSEYSASLTAGEVVSFVTQLEKLFFLQSGRSEQEIARLSRQAAKAHPLISRLLFIKLGGFDPGRFLDRLTRAYRPFHNVYGFTAAMGVIVSGLVVLAANSSQFTFVLSDMFHMGSIMAIVIGLFLLVSLHEFAHGVICRYYGGTVPEIGFLLLYFQPCFYCDLSDAWLFEKKSHRLAVTAAGPFFQLVVLCSAVFAWRVTVSGVFVNELAWIVVIVSAVTLLFNLNPLIKLDGYYLLSDWLDIPNLRDKSFAYLGNVVKRRLLGWPIDRVQVSNRERRIFVFYALSATVYSVALLTYLLNMAAEFLYVRMGVTGLLLLAAALAITLRSSLIGAVRGFAKHLRYMKNLLKQPIRLTVNVALVVLAIVLLFLVPVRQHVSGEVTAQAIMRYDVFLNDFGLLERRLQRGGAQPEVKSSYLQMTSSELAALDLVPFVTNGQAVSAGDTLAVLISSQVTSQLEAELSRLEQLQGDLALLRSPPKTEQLAELEAQLRAAQAKYDQYNSEHERISDLSDKGLISQRELQAARAAVDVADADVQAWRAKLELLQSPPKPEEVTVVQAQIDKQLTRISFLRVQKASQVITAPFAGDVGSVRDDDRILTLLGRQQVELSVPVSDFDIGLVQIGQSALVKMRSHPGLLFEGQVVRVSRQALIEDGGSHFPVSVVVDNSDGTLQDGMTGYAKIDVGESSLFHLAARKVMGLFRVEFWSMW